MWQTQPGLDADSNHQQLFLRLSCAEQDLADSISDMSKGNDWFLVAPDFTDYLRAQARSRQMSHPHEFTAAALTGSGGAILHECSRHDKLFVKPPV